MQYSLGNNLNEQKKIPRTSLMLLLSFGIVAALVLSIISLIKLIGSTIPEISNALLFALILIVALILAMVLFWLSNKIFLKARSAPNRILVRQQNDDINQTKHIDTNPALIYLNNESEEEKDSAELLENALSLWSIEIKECLIPRNEIVGVEINDPIDDIKNSFIESKHSKLIVYENDTDNILGYVHHSDFYDDPSNLQELIREIPTVPETMTAIEMLSFFKKKQKVLLGLLMNLAARLAS